MFNAGRLKSSTDRAVSRTGQTKNVKGREWVIPRWCVMYTALFFIFMTVSTSGTSEAPTTVVMKPMDNGSMAGSIAAKPTMVPPIRVCVRVSILRLPIQLRNIYVEEDVTMLNISEFNNNLLAWYQANKRDLPWRRTSDPYHIWLSEVMLQQTQVINVIPYFEKFITNYPDLDTLADADEGSLLKDWEGLGYYNRIRNFHAAVKEVQRTYDSTVPDDPDAFFSLKGVGPYIGGAVQSIAFNNLLAAVDGNVLRVMARLNLDYRCITKSSVQKAVKQDIEAIMPLEAGDFNQALKELGAVICTPRTPKCIMCPVQEHCEAYKEGQVSGVLVKKRTKSKKEI